jgi:predicted alpha/beta hydrolase
VALFYSDHYGSITRSRAIYKMEISPSAASPQPFTQRAADGYPIRGFCWCGPRRGGERAIVIVTPATAVRCRYYFRFAAFLSEHGFDALLFDYRGIGESRPERLRGFEASWMDWGRLDFEAVLQHAAESFPGQPIHVAAHSAGGFLIGLAPSNHRIRRVFSVGAQYANWRDYAPGAKARMLLKWHVAMPLITAAAGYFPGRKLGWMEDTPSGVVRDWAHGRFAARLARDKALARQFAAFRAPTLAVSVTDDEFATIPAVERLLTHFCSSPRMHLRITPQAIGEPSIGHFGFFHSRFAEKLWRIPVEWLKTSQLAEEFTGMLVPRGAGMARNAASGDQ